MKDRINIDGRIIRGSISFIILSLITTSFSLNPLKYDLNKCGFKEMTGYSCPSCGMTRSFYSLSHGQIMEAFSYHLLGPVIYLFLISLTVKLGYEATTGKKIKIYVSSYSLKVAIITFFTIWLIYWIVKMFGEMGLFL